MAIAVTSLLFSNAVNTTRRSAVGLDHAPGSKFLEDVKDREVTVLGGAGTTTFFDPMGVHHGGECEGEGRRVILQLMFARPESGRGRPSKPMPEAKAGPPVQVRVGESVLGITAKTHFWEVEETIAAVGGTRDDVAEVTAALVRHRLDTCRPWEAYEKERPGHKGYHFEYEMSHSTLFCNYVFALDDLWTGRRDGPLKLLEVREQLSSLKTFPTKHRYRRTNVTNISSFAPSLSLSHGRSASSRQGRRRGSLSTSSCTRSRST